MKSILQYYSTCMHLCITTEVVCMHLCITTEVVYYAIIKPKLKVMRLEVNHKLTLFSGNYSYTFAPSVQSRLDWSGNLDLVFVQIMDSQAPIKSPKM